MNLWIILAIVAVICLMNRGSGRERERENRHHRRRNRGDDQIEKLKHRVSVLEEVLLDRDRRLRDDFRGL